MVDTYNAQRRDGDGSDDNPSGVGRDLSGALHGRLQA